MRFLLVKINAPPLCPVDQGFLNITLRQIEVLCQLPKLRITGGESLPELRVGQIFLGTPPVGPIFAAAHQLKGTVHLVQGAGGDVAHFVAADPAQQPGGLDFCEVQKWANLICGGISQQVVTLKCRVQAGNGLSLVTDKRENGV